MAYLDHQLSMRQLIPTMQDVPKPPQEEITQLEKMQEARRLLQAQTLAQQQKKVSFQEKQLSYCRSLGSVSHFSLSRISLDFKAALY